MTGIISKWDGSRGFGFIRVTDPDDYISHYFLHVSEIRKGEPSIGSQTIFQAGERTRGSAAPALQVEVEPLTKQSAQMGEVGADNGGAL
jgi:cold shock CspA family protein